MNYSEWMDKILLIIAILILGGGLFILFDGVLGMNKIDKK